MVYRQHIPSSNLPIKRAERLLPFRVSARASAFPPRVRDTTTRPLASRVRTLMRTWPVLPLTMGAAEQRGAVALFAVAPMSGNDFHIKHTK